MREGVRGISNDHLSVRIESLEELQERIEKGSIKNYGEAISSYDMALANNYSDVVSYAYRAESKILYGKPKEGLEDLKKVIEFGEVNPEFEQWVKRSRFLLKIHGATE